MKKAIILIGILILMTGCISFRDKDWEQIRYIEGYNDCLNETTMPLMDMCVELSKTNKQWQDALKTELILKERMNKSCICEDKR